MMMLPQLRVDTSLGRSHYLSHEPRPILSAVEHAEQRPALFAPPHHDGPQDPFGTLSAIFASHNKSSEFWWHTTGAAFAQMLQGAFYPLHQQYRYLVFYYLVVLPEFGPAPPLALASLDSLRDPPKSAFPSHTGRMLDIGLPTPPSSSSPSSSCGTLPIASERFQSYMTDDHSPIELSWLFDNEGGAVVRFAIDPVRRQIEGDPRGAMGLFEDLAGMKVLARGVDLDWCRVCADTLTLRNTGAGSFGKSTPEYPSQYFVGFDFSSLGIVMKAYFLPETRSALTSTPKTSMVTSCITALSSPSPSCANPPDLLTPWRRTLSFFDSLPADITLSINIVAVDCVPSRQNRVKVYARTPRATLANLRRFLTLDRDLSLTSPATQRAISQITSMWRLLFPTLQDDEEPPCAPHPTGGLLWYYELRAGHSEPFPKVYLPMRHWCQSDEQVVDVVETFYRQVGNFKAAERYGRDVRDTFKHRPLSARAGIHTYITFAVKANEVEVTSYFNPECYAPERECVF